jgi:hypothetical protein
MEGLYAIVRRLKMCLPFHGVAVCTRLIALLSERIRWLCLMRWQRAGVYTRLGQNREIRGQRKLQLPHGSQIFLKSWCPHSPLSRHVSIKLNPVPQSWKCRSEGVNDLIEKAGIRLSMNAREQ